MTSSQYGPSFQGFLKASGLAEIYYSNEDKKLQELGWGTTTNEGNYSQTTLIGNWSENSFDVKEMAKRKPLPSQHEHYFNTTYKVSYHNKDHVKRSSVVEESLRTANNMTTRAFPGHQPELDSPELQATYNAYVTCSQDAYRKQ